MAYSVTNQAVLKNIIIENVDIVGSGYVGALAGEVIHGSVENCYVIGKGKVMGGFYVGGLIGVTASNVPTPIIYNSGTSIDVAGLGGGSDGIGGLIGANSAFIENCYATGNISGEYVIGGLIGYSGGDNGYGNITRCYATGNVIGGQIVGGLIGSFDFGAITVSDSYATGAVSGTMDIGGIVGYSIASLTLQNSYFAGTVTNPNPQNMLIANPSATTTIISSYFDSTVAGISTPTGQARTSAQMKTQSTFVGWDFSTVWDIDADISYPLLWNHPEVILPSPESELITIKTVADLKNINNNLSERYMLGNDIDLNNELWTPIGISPSKVTAFSGTFDGNGFSIRNLKINRTEEITGLFGLTHSAALKNIVIDNVDVIGGDYVGALVGVMENGVIENCHIRGNGQVEGRHSIGGLVGINIESIATPMISSSSTSIDVTGSEDSVGGLAGESVGNIKDCFTTGNISGYYDCGGLVGYMRLYSDYDTLSRSIERCYTTGDISNISARSGGLIGHTYGGEVLISECYAIGEIHDDYSNGGLVGYANDTLTIEDSYFAGTLSEITNPMVLVGDYDTMPVITNTYFDSDLVGVNTPAEYARTTEEMKTKSTFTGWDFDSVWDINEGVTYPMFKPKTISPPNGSDPVFQADVVQIDGGANHTLLLAENGMLWAWGDNGYNQLVDGTTIDRSKPVQVQGITDVKAISTGSNHNLALREDNTVWAWGINTYGQIGDNTTVIKMAPVQVQGLTDVIAIAAGDRHSLALKEDGTLLAWGYNTSGQLGDNTKTNSKIPVQVQGLTDIIAITSGNNHNLALKEDGTVWAFGENGSGQLGDNTTTDRSIPVQVRGLTGIKAIASGSNHNFAIKEDGSVFAWGRNYYGNLADGTTTNRRIPVQVQELTGVVKIAAGEDHSLAIDEDGTVLAWGWNIDGQLGDGTTESKTMPVQVQRLTDVKTISAGGNHSIAMKEDGSIWIWGLNESGQLGDGTTVDKAAPVLTLTPDSDLILQANAAQIAAGEDHTLMVTEEGDVWGWGSDSLGQIASNSINGVMSPVIIEGITDAKTAAGGQSHSLVLKTNGELWGFGYNLYGQLGVEGSLMASPVQILSNIKGIAAGSLYSLALKEDGTVLSFGYNYNGQLGDGTTDNRKTPVQVLGLTDIKAVASSGNTSMVLSESGQVWMWGGIIGSTPKQVSGLTSVKAIAASNNGSLGNL